MLAAIDAGAAGDEKLQLLIEGIYDEMRGAELQELLGVDEKGLAWEPAKLLFFLAAGGGLEPPTSGL